MAETEKQKVRWGIIGCGSIATHAISPALKWSDLCDLKAVASRERTTALQKAREIGAERHYGSYEDLLADDDIDAVYIGLPNGLHEEWAIRATEAGKHVLCEKSLSLNSASARTMIEAAEKAGVRLMEAYMYRHHPQWDGVFRAIMNGRIGEVRMIRAGLAGNLVDTSDHRWSASLGGGALYDVTCYGINVARFIYAREPMTATASADRNTRERVDNTSVAILDFGHGRMAAVTGSLRSWTDQYCEIIGTEGRISVERPFIPGWEEAAIIIESGMNHDRIEIGGANHFLHEVEHFSLCVLDSTRPLAPGENGLNQALVNEAIEQSWISGKTVEVLE